MGASAACGLGHRGRLVHVHPCLCRCKGLCILFYPFEEAAPPELIPTLPVILLLSLSLIKRSLRWRSEMYRYSLQDGSARQSSFQWTPTASKCPAAFVTTPNPPSPVSPPAIGDVRHSQPADYSVENGPACVVHWHQYVCVCVCDLLWRSASLLKNFNWGCQPLCLSRN